jgi:hypothetical protein
MEIESNRRRNSENRSQRTVKVIFEPIAEIQRQCLSGGPEKQERSQNGPSHECSVEGLLGIRSVHEMADKAAIRGSSSLRSSNDGPLTRQLLSLPGTLGQAGEIAVQIFLGGWIRRNLLTVQGMRRSAAHRAAAAPAAGGGLTCC